VVAGTSHAAAPAPPASAALNPASDDSAASNPSPADSAGPHRTAAGSPAKLLAQSDIPGGICAVAGCTGRELPLALAAHKGFTIHALFPDEATLAAAREAIRARGLYGRVSADCSDLQRLPYAENLINVLVVEQHQTIGPDGLWPGEMFRVLAPLGVVYVGGPAAVGQNEPAWAPELRGKLKAAGFARPELVRAGGTWLMAAKPWPREIDEWTHHLHAADGNPVANDLVVGPPARYQWVSEPRWAQSHETDSSFRCLVTARGRLYYIVNQAPTSLAGPQSPPDEWFLAARDAFNGVLLWKRPIEHWGWREWKPSWFTPRPGVIPINLDKRVVAAGDELFATLGFRAPVSRLDGRTGKVLQTYAGTERTSEILFHDGRLVLTVLEGSHDREQGVRARVKLLDAQTGKLLWTTARDYGGTVTDYYRFSAMRGSVPPAKVDPTLDIATDGGVVGLLDGASVVCLDFATGAERWRTEFPLVEADYTAGRIDAYQKVWTGTMIVSDGVLVHASPHQLAAFSAQTGKVLWTQPKRFLQHLWYEWKDVFVIDGLVWTWSAEVAREKLEGGGFSSFPLSVNGYDLHTGELKRQVALGCTFKTHHHHRCYRNKATVRYILASRRGSEYVDLSGGPHSINNWVRGTCHMGMMPANGLQYATPHPCQCYIDEKLNGLNALAAADRPRQQHSVANTTAVDVTRQADTSADAADTQRSAAHVTARAAQPRLERAPTFTAAADTAAADTAAADTAAADTAAADATPADWPTFRADAERSGFVRTDLPADLRALWSARPGRRVGPPVSVGRSVFVPLVDEHQVVALDAADGSEQWRFTAGARIDSPPTFDRGAVLFGSADGWIYRVDASTGRLIWRFRAAPEDRRIGAFGQLESAWPVHGSVLVLDDPAEKSARGSAAGSAGDSAASAARVSPDDSVGTAAPRLACFAAGRSSYLDGGLYLFAIDAATGEVRHKRKLSGPHYTSANIKQNYLLPMGVLPDILRREGSHLFMRGVGFDMQLRREDARPTMRLLGGFLDDAYFKRMPWSIGRSGHARVLVNDGERAYLLRMFDSLQGLDPKVYFTPGKQGYLLFAHDLQSGKNAWQQRVPIRGRALAVTTEQLCVAGPPDVVDPHDPLGAFEGRKGGVLRLVDKRDGRTLSEHRLDSPPVFNGAAAARRRLFLALENGTVVCFGQPAAPE